MVKTIEEGGRMCMDIILSKQNKLKRFTREEKHLLIVEEKIHVNMDFNEFISLIKGKTPGVSSQTLTSFGKDKDPFQLIQFIFMPDNINDEHLIPCLESFQNL